MKQGAPDDFQTPPEAIEPLLPHLVKSWTIWEPAAGFGWMAQALRDGGHRVVVSDKYYESEFSHDFLDLLLPDQDFDCIVTNPPYSLKQQFLERCVQIGTPFALLLPLTTLETKKRQALMERCNLDVLLLPKRINFRTPSGEGSGSWFATAWFTYGLAGFDSPIARLYIDWTKH